MLQHARMTLGLTVELGSHNFDKQAADEEWADL